MGADCSPFQRVEAARAGPTALGILVPPGKKTLLILRPRSLPFDLVPLAPVDRPDHSRSLWELSRDDAARLARDVFHCLESLTRAGDDAGRVELLRLPRGECLLQALLGEWTLLGCKRRPGHAYQPMTFADVESASESATRLTAILSPPLGQTQQIYFNTQGFEG